MDSSRSREKHSPAAYVSPYTSFVLSPLPEYFTTEQSTVEASLFVKSFYCIVNKVIIKKSIIIVGVIVVVNT